MASSQLDLPGTPPYWDVQVATDTFLCKGAPALLQLCMDDWAVHFIPKRRPQPLSWESQFQLLVSVNSLDHDPPFPIIAGSRKQRLTSRFRALPPGFTFHHNSVVQRVQYQQIYKSTNVCRINRCWLNWTQGKILEGNVRKCSLPPPSKHQMYESLSDLESLPRSKV